MVVPAAHDPWSPWVLSCEYFHCTSKLTLVYYMTMTVKRRPTTNLRKSAECFIEAGEIFQLTVFNNKDVSTNLSLTA